MEYSTIENLLRQRGHEVTKLGQDKDILIPRINDADLSKVFKDLLFNLMQKPSFKKSLRDWAYTDKPSLENKFDLVNSYLTIGSNFNKEFGRLKDNAELRRSFYATTFEWYISELMVRKFGARVSGFGICLKDASPEDEFDSISVIDDGLVLVECKTGRESLLRGVEKFVRRDTELSASYSLYIFDRDWTFDKEHDDIPDIKMSEARNSGMVSLQRISYRGLSFYSVRSQERWFLAASAFSNLEDCIRYMLRYSFFNRQTGGLHHPGYAIDNIQFANG
ncbi:MAG TPA: hypothetical protein VEP90_30605 [Methylomirabilota bacterium]|nr:hypothetical protein [Methylomirabilota bacterium]